MKQTRLFITILSSITIAACSSGGANNNNIPNINTAYGNLEDSAVLSTGYSTADLQEKVQPLGICLGMTIPGTDTPITTPLQNPLCQLNNRYIAADSKLFNSIPVNEFITNNPAGVTNVTPYRLIYNTPGQPYNFAGSPSNERVSGLVLVPNGSIKGVVLYYHPTVLDKSGGVPTNLLNPEGRLSAYNLAAIYASQGYIVVAPDYVGQGIDTGVMHPYSVYPQVNALSGIYMLSAARKFLAQQNIQLPQSTPLNLYISSYSEGGPYALWASRFLQSDYAGILTENNLTLKRTIGISGAYNLSGIQIPYVYQNSSNLIPNEYNASPGITQELDKLLLDSFYSDEKYAFQVGFANFNMAVDKAVLGSYAFAAFINYNFNTAAYNVFFKSNTAFLAMNQCLNFNAYLNPSNSQIILGNCPINGVSLAQLFMDPSYDGERIGNQIAASAMGGANFFTNGQTFNQVIATIFSGGTSNNSIGAFANQIPAIVQDVLAQADTWQFTTNNPISLVYMKYDSTVTNVNSKYACSKISGKPGIMPVNQLNCLEIDNTKLYSQITGGLPLFLEHERAEFIANLVALAQIQQDQ